MLSRIPTTATPAVEKFIFDPALAGVNGATGELAAGAAGAAGCVVSTPPALAALAALAVGLPVLYTGEYVNPLGTPVPVPITELWSLTGIGYLGVGITVAVDWTTCTVT